MKDLLVKDDYKSMEEIAVLFVTSPLRTVEDIILSYDKFQNGHDSLLSVTRFNQPPQFALKVKNNNVIPYFSYDYFWKSTQKNRLEPLFFPNFSIQMCKRNIIFDHNGFVD